MTAITPPHLQETEKTERARRAAAWHHERTQQLAPKFCDKCGEQATLWIGGMPLTYLCETHAKDVAVRLWVIN